ncbi:membrane-bound alpha-1,6- mannosyltransferase Initiation-specific [Entophlyctis sp. JEL0112]|nr:membrane-bound alpha-1,6- mannosyltransferase Initiation-specific [Entophlyctis sp. JEL0112]
MFTSPTRQANIKQDNSASEGQKLPSFWMTALMSSARRLKSLRGHRRLRFATVFAALVGVTVFANFLAYSHSQPAVLVDEQEGRVFNLMSSANSLVYPARNVSNISYGHSPIPQLILRTWKTGDRVVIKSDSKEKRDHPDRYKWLETWDKLNPAATQIIFSDDDMDKLVRGAFSHRVVEAYFKLPRIVLRSDFARYMMLYELGGFYSDMDTSCSVPVNQWNLGFENTAVIIGVENPSKDKDSYLQWTMAAAPHHPLLANIIYRVTEKIHETDEKKLAEDDGVVLDVTGPGIWKEVIWEYLEREGVDLKLISNMWDGFALLGDVLVLGKSYMNNDNSANPKSLIRHHFTGNSEYGWRIHGKNTSISKTFSLSSFKELDFSYNPPLQSLVLENASKSPTKIPSQIFIVANTSDPSNLPFEFQTSVELWELHNPEYDVHLFNETEMEDFVRSSAKPEEKAAFFKLPKLRQRLEFFRYLLLLHNGGVYTDLSTRPLSPVQAWIMKNPHVGLVLGIKDQSHPEGPAFTRSPIISKPYHPLIEKYVDGRVKEIHALSDSTLLTVSFYDLFENSFTQHAKNVMAEVGFNITEDFRKVAWDGFFQAQDILVLGQERFAPSNGRSKLMFARNEGGVFDKHNGIWDEDYSSTSKL